MTLWAAFRALILCLIVSGVFCAAAANESGGAGGAAIWPKLRAVSSFGVGTGSASVAINSPNTDDLILAWVTEAGDSTATINAPAGEGWTNVTTASNAGGAGYRVTLFYKYWGHGSTDTSSPTFTSTNGTTTCGVVFETWQNVRQASPVNTSTTANGAGGTSIASPDATNSAAERVSVSCCTGGLTAAGNISSINGSLYTQTAAGASYATTSGPDQAVALAKNENIAVAGSVGANGVTATFTVANTAYGAITVILRGP